MVVKTKQKTIQRSKKSTDNSINQTVKVSVKISGDQLKKKAKKTRTKKSGNLKKSKEFLKQIYEAYNKSKEDLISTGQKIPVELMVQLDSTKLKTPKQINELSKELILKTQKLRSLASQNGQQSKFTGDFTRVIQRPEVGPQGTAQLVAGITQPINNVTSEDSLSDQQVEDSLSDQQVEEALNNAMSDQSIESFEIRQYVDSIKTARNNKLKLESFIADIASKIARGNLSDYEAEQYSKAEQLAKYYLNQIVQQDSPTLPSDYESNLAELAGTFDGHLFTGFDPLIGVAGEDEEDDYPEVQSFLALRNDTQTYKELLIDSLRSYSFDEQEENIILANNILESQPNTLKFENNVVKSLKMLSGAQLDGLANNQQIGDYNRVWTKDRKAQFIYNYFKEGQLVSVGGGISLE